MPFFIRLSLLATLWLTGLFSTLSADEPVHQKQHLAETILMGQSVLQDTPSAYTKQILEDINSSGPQDWLAYFQLHGTEFAKHMIKQYGPLIMTIRKSDQKKEPIMIAGILEAARYLSRRKDDVNLTFLRTQVTQLVEQLNHPDPNIVTWSLEYRLIVTLGQTTLNPIKEYYVKHRKDQKKTNQKKYALRLLGQIAAEPKTVSPKSKKLQKEIKAFLQNIVKNNTDVTEWEKTEAKIGLRYLEK